MLGHGVLHPVLAEFKRTTPPAIQIRVARNSPARPPGGVAVVVACMVALGTRLPPALARRTRRGLLALVFLPRRGTWGGGM